MSIFYSSILITVFSTLLYHLAIKFTPVDANPALSLIVTYLTAALLCVILFQFMPLKIGILNGLNQLNWTSIGLAFALVGIEVGFILAYRAGWKISMSALLVNVAVTVLLVPVGILLLREKLSATNFAGIVVCIVGLVMVNAK